MMLVADVDWNPIILGLIGLLSVGLTGWIAIRQSQINSKVELARLEVIKRDKRRGRQLKKLSGDTEVQTEIMKETNRKVDTVERQTNGMTARLVAEAEERATRAADALATNMAANAAKAAAVPPAPLDVNVVNQEPMPVEVVEHQEPKE